MQQNNMVPGRIFVAIKKRTVCLKKEMFVSGVYEMDDTFHMLTIYVLDFILLLLLLFTIYLAGRLWIWMRRCNSFRVSRSSRHFRYCFTLCLGIFLSLTCNLARDRGYIDFGLFDVRGNFLKETLAETATTNMESPALSMEVQSFGGKNFMSDRIWFVTVTEDCLTQPPALTRIGQALFPVRHFVNWLIIKHEHIPEIVNDTISKGTTDIIVSIVSRFGVPFVILKSAGVHIAEMGNKGFPTAFSSDGGIAGRQTALTWILMNVKNGVLFLAHEHFTYDYHLFNEVRSTSKVAVWPVGLCGPDNFVCSPVVKSGETEVSGFFDGSHMNWNGLQILLGGFAINIKYLNALEKKSLWKFTYDGKYSFETAGVPLRHVKLLAESGRKIYVWRSKTQAHRRPGQIILGNKFNNTNIIVLLKKIYNYQYSEIVSFLPKRTKAEAERMRKQREHSKVYSRKTPSRFKSYWKNDQIWVTHG